MTIGDRIRTRREELGLTQKELAERLGYKTKSSITKIEAGDNNLPITKVAKIAKALEVTESYLMGWEDSAIVPADGHTDAYYLNPETAKAAQKVFDDPNYRILFDAAADSAPEDILMVAEMLRRFKEAKK